MQKIKLISYTPQPEITIATAAKLCYSALDIDDISEGITEQTAGNFVNMLSTLGHESPIEHANFTFAIEGVSRSLLAQITRHRIASFSVQSQRYVKADKFEFVTPPQIVEIPAALQEYQQTMALCIEKYQKLTDILFKKHYATLISQNVSEKKAKSLAEKMAIEDARFVLPNAATTKMIVTMNARSLKNFFKLRCCERAQWEIRELAQAMFKEVIKVAPNIFANSGPSCVGGECSEGKMTCGKIVEVREHYKRIREGSIK